MKSRSRIVLRLSKQTLYTSIYIPQKLHVEYSRPLALASINGFVPPEFKHRAKVLSAPVPSHTNAARSRRSETDPRNLSCL